jgi:hypothetical protein
MMESFAVVNAGDSSELFFSMLNESARLTESGLSSGIGGIGAMSEESIDVEIGEMSWEGRLRSCADKAKELNSSAMAAMSPDLLKISLLPVFNFYKFLLFLQPANLKLISISTKLIASYGQKNTRIPHFNCCSCFGSISKSRHGAVCQRLAYCCY